MNDCNGYKMNRIQRGRRAKKISYFFISGLSNQQPGISSRLDVCGASTRGSIKECNMYKTLAIISTRLVKKFIYCIIFLTRKRSTFSILECYNCRFVLFYQILQHDFEGDLKCMKQTVIGSYSSFLRLYRCYIFLMLQGVNVFFFLCFTSDVNEVICTQKENVKNE